MSDDTKIIDRNPGTPQAPIQPVQTATGSLNKEVLGPTEANSTTASLPESQPAGAEVGHDIAKEVTEAGVRKVEGRPFLTDQHKQAGLDHSVPPPQTAPTGLVQLPMTREEAAMEAKGNKGNSITWLAALFGRVLKMGLGQT